MFISNSEEELRELLLTKGCFDEKKNLRIYNKFFLGTRPKIEKLWSILKLKNKKVLDIGCSFGQNLIHFPQGSVGIELHSGMVEFANGLGLKVISANIENRIPVGDKSFDIIYCRDVLEHLASPHSALIEFYRILRTDGKLVLDVRNMDGVGSKSWNSPQHLYAFNNKSLIFLLGRAGFKVEKYIVLNHKLSRILNCVTCKVFFAKLMPTLCVVAEKIPDFSYDDYRLKLLNQPSEGSSK